MSYTACTCRQTMWRWGSAGNTAASRTLYNTTSCTALSCVLCMPRRLPAAQQRCQPWQQVTVYGQLLLRQRGMRIRPEHQIPWGVERGTWCFLEHLCRAGMCTDAPWSLYQSDRKDWAWVGTGRPGLELNWQGFEQLLDKLAGI